MDACPVVNLTCMKGFTVTNSSILFNFRLFATNLGKYQQGNSICNSLETSRFPMKICGRCNFSRECLKEIGLSYNHSPSL